jgi:cytochrome c-type biogenesis protein CcmE
VPFAAANRTHVALTPPPLTDVDTGAESADSAELPGAAAGTDGCPSDAGLVRPRRPLFGSRRRQIVAFGILVVAIGLLVFQGLGNATVYFKTADEAVAQRVGLGNHRFRIEGTVQPGVRQVGQDVGFAIANNGTTVEVIHHGGPPELFQPGIPVVLEGHFAPDGHFASDLIMVKHTASYTAKHPDRVNTAKTTVSVPAP